MAIYRQQPIDQRIERLGEVVQKTHAKIVAVDKAMSSWRALREHWVVKYNTMNEQLQQLKAKGQDIEPFLPEANKLFTDAQKELMLLGDKVKMLK